MELKGWKIKFLLVAFSLMASAMLSRATVDIGSMTWTPRSDWLNVKNCSSITGGPNAVGDGVADDTAAIQAALNCVCGNFTYKTLYFPPGTYNVSSTLSAGSSTNGFFYIALIGSGNLTTIQWKGATGGAIFNLHECIGVLYEGFIFDGLNTAGCGFELYSPDGHYDGNYRFENDSFRNFTANGTYLGGGHAAVPGAGIAAGFTVNGVSSLQGDSMIVNCRFSNCTYGYFNGWDFGNNMEWLIDGCEFDSCNHAVDFILDGDDSVQNTHFQNDVGLDVASCFTTTVRHCTSEGSNIFYYGYNNSYGTDSIQDCWVDGWTNPTFAVAFGASGGDLVMDNTFTNAPVGSAGVIANFEGWDWYQYIMVSNNYAPNFPSGMGLFSNGSGTNPMDVLPIPAGTRMSSLTSPTQTFLNSSNFVDSTHILDVTKAPYNADPSGTNDSTTAVQAALTAASTANNGSVVYFPVGHYKISASLTVSGGNYTIQGSHDSVTLNWAGGSNATMLAISNPQSVLVEGLSFGGGDATVNGIEETATGASSITYRELSLGATWTAGPVFVLSNLPAGSSAYLDHVTGSISVQNCGAALVTGRFLQNKAITVSGAGPKTGLLGFTFSEGGNTFDSSGYNIAVNDNQDLIMQDYYSERGPNDLQMLRGTGTGTGRVTIEGYNDQTVATNTQVTINNYAGRLFVGPQQYANNWGSVPVQITQTGSNPIDMMFANLFFYDAAPDITVDTGANLLLELDKLWVGNQTQFVQASPTNVTGSNLVSFTAALDHMRQLGAVDLQSRFGIATDAPPLVSYAFEGDCTDEMGNYNGTNHGVAFGDGAVGANGGIFDGVSSYVDLHNPPTLPSGRAPRTLAGWAKTTDSSAAWRFFASFGTNAYGNAMFLGSYGTTLYCGSGFGDDLTVPNFWDNNWHYIVLTYDGTTASLYADGVLKTSAVKTDWNLIPDGTYIGCCSDHTSFWKGSADQVQIYNYALSAGDVSNIYNRERANMPMAAEWQLTETTGSTSADSSGNNDTGTWENSPTPTTDHPANAAQPETGSLSFNAASSQDVNMGNPRDLPFGMAPHTLCGWAKSAGMTGEGMIASFGNLSQSWTGMYIGAGSDGKSLLAGFGGADLPAVANFWDGNWHFICFAYDGTTASLYADGHLLETQLGYWPLIPQYCYIGCNLNHQDFWNGSISDVRIYNRCLTASDVAGMVQGNVSLSDFSFESPAVGAANFQSLPTGTPWTFSGSSGVQSNGSVWVGSNAPDGTQTAYIQGSSSISQTFTAGSGTYTVSFMSALRPYYNTQSLNVEIDGNVVGSFTPTSTSFSNFTTNPFTITTPGSHTLTFVGLATVDATDFIDAVSVQPDLVANASFETPNIGTASIVAAPSGAVWTFGGSSGFESNGSAFGAPNSPDGTQGVYLQGNGASISQTFTASSPGLYTVSFMTAKRDYENPANSPPQSFNVLIDGTVVGSYTPSNDQYVSYTTTPVTISTAGTHTVSFVGTSTSGDVTDFLDTIGVQQIPAETP